MRRRRRNTPIAPRKMPPECFGCGKCTKAYILTKEEITSGTRTYTSEFYQCPTCDSQWQNCDQFGHDLNIELEILRKG